MKDVPTLHIPMNKEVIRNALNDRELTVQYKCKPDIYIYATK